MITYLLLTLLALSGFADSNIEMANQEISNSKKTLISQKLPSSNAIGFVQKTYENLNSDGLFSTPEKVYLQFDRTFCEPGDAIWFSAFVRNANDLTPSEMSQIIYVELIAPNGNVQKKYKLLTQNGQAAGDFLIDENAAGGLYKIKAYTNWQRNFDQVFERDIQVQKSILPNLRMKLEFERKAYGSSDEVVAKLDLKDLENSPLSEYSFTVSASLDGQQFTNLNGQTDAFGKAKIRFDLPQNLTTNDGLLNVKIEYKGQTESIARSIPIVLNKIDLQFFPEGGDLVSEIPSKIAFKAINEFGKPADIQGVVFDSDNNEVAQFKSYHDGMGAFDFLPKKGENYVAKITKPESIQAIYELPEILENGYGLNVLSNDKNYVQLRISSSKKESLYLKIRSGEKDFEPKMIELENAPADWVKTDDNGRIHFDVTMSSFDATGVGHITLFNAQKNPVAERLVFLNPHKKLNVEIKTDKEEYTPREKVKMTVKVSDESGNPVAGQFAMAVTDDKLLTFADDKQGHILSHILLESELKGDIHEPNFYFDDPKEHPEKDQILALDYLMMTQGWRRFAWEEVLEKPLTELEYEGERIAIRGVVLNANRKPVRGAWVNYEGNKIRTDKNGYFEFEEENELTYTRYIEVSKGENHRASYRVTSALKKHTIILHQLEEQGSYTLIQSSNNSNQANLRGRLVDGQTGEGMIFASVALLKNGTLVTGCETDFDGYFHLRGLPEGEYEVECSYLGYQTMEVYPVILYKGVDNQLDINMSNDVSSLSEVTVIAYEVPLIERDNTTQGGTLTSQSIRNLPTKRRNIRKKEKRRKGNLIMESPPTDIPPPVIEEVPNEIIEEEKDEYVDQIVEEEQAKNLPTKSINALAATTAGEKSTDEGGELGIRGSRSNGTDYYLDGVRVSGRMVPQQNIEQLQTVVGGTPAAVENNFGIEEQEIEFVDQSIEEETVMERKERIMVPPPPPPPPASEVEEIFKVVEKMPSFPGCEYLSNRAERDRCANEKLLEFVYRNLDYPKIARENAIQGTVVVRFIVETDGSIVDAQIVRDIGGLCGKEALEIVKKMPKWNPGKQRGRLVKVQFNLPIRFDLESNSIQSRKYNRNFAKKRGQVLESGLYIPRQFYVPKYELNEMPKTRDDFRETIYWNPTLNIPVSGETTVEFHNSDDITTFRATVEGFGSIGNVGRGTTTFFVKQPFSMSAKVPSNLLSGDVIQVPLMIANNMNRKVEGQLSFDIPKSFITLEDLPIKQILSPNESKTIYLPFKINERIGEGELHISFKSRLISDAFSQKIKASPRGFPMEEVFSGNSVNETFTFDITNPIEGSLEVKFSVHPSVTSDLVSGLDRMLRQPNGCFEQTSSSNYPNILVLDYLKSTETINNEIEKRANNFLKKGYNRLKTFEVKGGGFDWYGRAPAHEGLTAYGIMQFKDMESVYPVENELITRTAKWLFSRRDGQGGWQKNKRHLHTWGMQNGISDAYIVWALCEAGYREKLNLEIEKSYKDALETEDPYIMALMANATWEGLNIRGSKYNVLMQKLLESQKEDGSWTGKTTSITSSRGKGLTIETTALATLALMKNGRITPEIRKAMEFISKSKTQYGFGSTQSTVLAMKSLVNYSKMNKIIEEGGTVELIVNNEKVASEKFKAGQQKSIVFEGIESYLIDNQNVVQVQFVGLSEGLPYDLNVKYTSLQPQNSADCPLKLETTLKSNDIKSGDNIRLTTIIKNTSDEAVPNPIAVVGIPAGLSVHPWQLKELKEKEVFDFYEIMDDGYIVFHYRSMEANAEKVIHLDLKAEMPGEFEAPASQAYLYYGNEYKVWSKPDKVTVR